MTTTHFSHADKKLKSLRTSTHLLKTVDTIGNNCQNPVFSLGVSQHYALTH